MGRKRALRRIEQAMDLPGGVLANIATVEIESNRRAVICGCQGILAYTEDGIALRTPEGQLTFYGRELELNCMSADGVVITGYLQRIEFGE